MTYSFLNTLIERVICDEFLGYVREKGINWNELSESYAIKLLAAIENVLERKISDLEKLKLISKVTNMASIPKELRED